MTTAQDKDALATKKARFKVLEDYWSDNRKFALEDMKFAAGDQWPTQIKKTRDDAGRPCLTVDKSGQYIRQVVNDSRQNRPAIKVRPIDDDGDVQIAEALQGLVRHIADRSNADDAYDCAIEHAVISGFGFIRVCTEYAHDNTFNQEILIERVANCLSVLLAPHQKADGSDAADVFIYNDIPKAEFKLRWPKAKETDWTADGYKEHWADDNTVRVCEYFYKVEEPTTRHLLADGTVVSDDDYQRALKEIDPQNVPPIQETRELPSVKIKWCRMTGAEILEESDWLGKYLPIVPVYGNETNIEGKTIYSGLIRAAKDAMRLYNYSRTAVAEGLSLSNKVPFIASAEAIEGYETEWQNANNSTASVLHYNAVDSAGNPLPAPQRQQGVVASEGFLRDMQVSEHDIQSAMGMFNASLGEKSNEKSGKAIMARQREGDTSTFHFSDNLNRAVRMVGQICVDLAPKIFDSRRVIRILGESGEATEAMSDPNQNEAVTKQGGKSIYNLSIGEYDVNIASGPSYTTRRVEQAEAMMQLVQSVPQTMQIAGDLVVKSQDWPNSEELSERFKMMLPPPVLQAMQKDDENASPEMQQAQQYVNQAMQQVQQQQEQMQQAQQQLQQAHQQVQQDQQRTEVNKASNAAQTAKLEADKHEIDSATKILMARYQELSAKLELQALKTQQTLPTSLILGPNETAINPNKPADAGFLMPKG